MATRNVGAGDLAPQANLSPGAVTGTQLQQGGVGFDALSALSDGQPLNLAQGDPIDIKAIQQRLRQFGYPIVIDGVWGPKSKAAWSDFTAKGGSMTAAPTAATKPAAPVGVPSPGAVAVAATAVTGAAPSAVPSPGGSPSERFPEMAALMEIPTVRWLLTRAVNEGWTPEKLSAEVKATDWWRTTPPAKRQFIALEAQDPMAAAQKIAETKDSIKKLNQAYMIDMSDDAMNMYARQVASGGSDAAQFQKETVERAKGKFPALAGALDQGLTVKQIADPYVQLAAKELEIPDTAVDLADPKWSRALQGFDEGGKPRTMTLYEWQRTIRTDAAYGYDRTSSARDQAAQIGESIARTFGKVG
jgi:hypothetical protein